MNQHESQRKISDEKTYCLLPVYSKLPKGKNHNSDLKKKNKSGAQVEIILNKNMRTHCPEG